MNRKYAIISLVFAIAINSITYAKGFYSNSELDNAMTILRENSDMLDNGEFILTGYSVNYETDALCIYGINWTKEREEFIKELTGINNIEFSLSYDFLEYGIDNRPEVLVYFNNHILYIDPQPVIMNDRVLVPMRAIFEAMDYTVLWDEEKGEALAVNSEGSISLIVENTNITKIDSLGNYSTVKADVAPKIIEERIYIPLRYISELSGYDVDWYDELKCVIIN